MLAHYLARKESVLSSLCNALQLIIIGFISVYNLNNNCIINYYLVINKDILIVKWYPNNKLQYMRLFCYCTRKKKKTAFCRSFTGSGRRGGLVVLRLDGLSKDSVDLHDVHALAELVLQLSEPLLCSDLLSGQTLHLVLILLLLTLQSLPEGTQPAEYMLKHSKSNFRWTTTRKALKEEDKNL